MKRALLLVVAAALLVPAAASPALVIQKSIAGVQIGMTQTQVRAKLGRPAKVVTGNNDFGPYTELRYATMQVTFQGRETVTGMRSTSRTERGPRGIGIGSTRAQVRAAVPGVRCEGSAAAGQCYVGKYLPGARVTAFFFTAGKVSELVLGVVID